LLPTALFPTTYHSFYCMLQLGLFISIQLPHLSRSGLSGKTCVHRLNKNHIRLLCFLDTFIFPSTLASHHEWRRRWKTNADEQTVRLPLSASCSSLSTMTNISFLKLSFFFRL
jgi:hypothetical protein